MAREARQSHNHVSQAASPTEAKLYAQEGCEACSLIREEVMTASVARYLRSTPTDIFGSPPQPLGVR